MNTKGVTLLTSEVDPAVRLERYLGDSAEVIWQAVTDRDQLRRWFPCDIVVTGHRWAVGAELTFVFPPEIIDMTFTGEVLAIDEPHRLSFSWGEETLTFELSPEDEGTRFVLTDQLPPSSAARNAAGWETRLDRLGGQPSSSDSWQSRFDAHAAAFEPILGKQDGPPAGYKGEQSGT